MHTTSSKTTRIAGAALLGSLASIVTAVGNFPSYDAREAYFAQSIPALFTQQAEWASGLRLLVLTGALAILAGVLFILAFSQSGRPNPLPGAVLIISGMGFFLSAGLGRAALRIIAEAAELTGSERLEYAGNAQPWASGSQTVLLMIGIGLFALGLLVTIVSMLRAGAFSRRTIMIAIASPAVLWIAIALFVKGAPLVWLVPGLPVAFWSRGLGVFLVITGRLDSPVSATA